MTDLSILTDTNFLTSVFFFLSYGLISWFMGWCVCKVASIFINIIN